MEQELELRLQDQGRQMYNTIEKYTTGISEMYSSFGSGVPRPTSSFDSGISRPTDSFGRSTEDIFRPASDLGIGPGIARPIPIPDIPDAKEICERYRAGVHELYAKDHVNLELFIQKHKINNIHINLKD